MEKMQDAYYLICLYLRLDISPFKLLFDQFDLINLAKLELAEKNWHVLAMLSVDSGEALYATSVVKFAYRMEGFLKEMAYTSTQQYDVASFRPF